LGQRKGLGLGGEGEPWFVYGKDRDRNEIRVVRGSEHPALYSVELEASELNWFAGHPPALEFDCTAKTRYRQTDQPCRVRMNDDGTAFVSFPEPQRAVTPGQYVVFYQGEVCLGGGIIAKVGPSLFELGRTR
jgi:tRNA-specific 2-thiouridylase